MKHIRFYLDFISPYAYLAFVELPRALEGLTYAVQYQPVLFGGLLKHNNNLGPAEVPMKREWVYRQSQWLARRQGTRLDLPTAHPFNPLGLLRLAVATDANGYPNRYVCETLFRHVWEGGADAADAQRLEALTQQVAPARDPRSDAVKQTAHALSQGVFGVPSYQADDKVFWGMDALPMLRAYLEDPASISDSAWNAAKDLPSGITRANR